MPKSAAMIPTQWENKAIAQQLSIHDPWLMNGGATTYGIRGGILFINFRAPNEEP